MGGNNTNPFDKERLYICKEYAEKMKKLGLIETFNTWGDLKLTKEGEQLFVPFLDQKEKEDGTV